MAAAGREPGLLLFRENANAMRLPYGRAFGDVIFSALASFCRGRSRLRRVCEVRPEDLLGRRPVDLACSGLREIPRGPVLVTGAGGSIGSELCRHIARRQPAALIGVDQSESALYEIDRELQTLHPHVRFYPEIGDIRDARRVEEIFRDYAPRSVYHAAAYKHVPLMEAHLFEAVTNNVFGTRNVARAAAESGVRDFVLISSDKAVRPANVMGATKRLAELVVLSLAGACRTRFVAVRFGNVLGSSGSVVRVFQEQIARGGPVTVTHPEMRRFFMTTPEAAQLVLEAGAMGRQGEIFVLEMGEPVRIVDLARKMIVLSGFKPGRDVEIEFIGIRPGEKLFEELSAYEENTVPTPHPQIRVLAGAAVPASEFSRGLEALRSAIEARDAVSAIHCLEQLVPDYHPSDWLVRRAIDDRVECAYA